MVQNIVAGETSAPKVVLGTTIKLNGAKYLLWAQAFRIFIGTQSKLPHLLASPPPTSDPTYNSWLSSDYYVMNWLLSSMEAQISNSGDKSVPKFFGELKGLIDELEMHQPAVADVTTLLRYRRDLAVSKFLSGLHPTLQSQVSTGVISDTTAPSPPTIDQSAIFSGRGRGHGRGHGRDSEGGCGSFGGRPCESDKRSRQYGHCGRTNHISEKCWEKFGRPQWAQISQADYERLRQLELSQNIHSATYAYSSSMDAYIDSSHKPWVLDSGASAHMTGIKDHFVSLHLSDKFSSIRIADVRGDGVVHATSSLKLIDVLYVPKFPVGVVHATSSLKLIDVLYVPKFPDLATGMKLGSGHERGGVYYLDDNVPDAGSESCELGKHHRATFQSRVDKRSSFAFELVHSDVWGPYRVPFVKGDVLKFCALNGIIHQTSCSYISQQNGVAERKHMHILDVARTLMIHMNVPKYLWSDVVLTDLTTGLDKLSSRSIKCVFIGYPRTQKGYRCYHPSTRKYFVSADVTFFEYVPYFSYTSTTIGCPYVPLSSSAPTTIPLPAPVAPAPKPLLTYSRRPKVHTPESAPEESSSPAASLSHVETSIPSDLDIPIALRKGKRSCLKYLISLFVSYDHLNSSFRQFALSLSTISIPRSHEEAMLVSAWKQAMNEEMNALLSRGTWDLVFLPTRTTVGENIICMLRKVIYGLKQSPQAWFDKFSNVISNVGFQRSETNEYLNRHFVTKDMGKPKYFLRIEVAYQKHGLLLSQRKYVLDLLEEGGLLECKPASTPMEVNVDLWRDDTSLLDDAGQYRRLIEKLIYLIFTGPDITFAVGVLSRFMHKPREVHWTAALKILAYVKSCPGKGLLYKKHGHTHISAFSDAGYAGDMRDRKSTLGFCTFVGGNLVT
ncbi:uncharacterized protein LOC109842493 [Asparagus officinalis]|uniref:uncharacterized protein LOC109842493 n=1 Tax=Asparagus officinalis TaxID=4686 RepID=UPI00098E5DC8|nr:uncharacterized protein LOC109842493 [Asparagus officinalis]